MHTARTRLQKFLSYVVSATVAVQAFGIFLPTSGVHAAAGDLIINELHWAGSTGNSSDEWFELYNNSGAAIDFSVTPYTFEISNEDNVVLDAVVLGATVPTLPNHDYLLVYNNPAGTTVKSSAVAHKFEPLVDFNLPNLPTNYRLLDSTLVEVDAIKPAGMGDGIPFEGTMVGVKSSMQRLGATSNGTNAMSWRTSNTVGITFKAGVEQYGTPGAANVELDWPTNNIFSPLGSTELPVLPVLSGDTDVLATDVLARITKMGPGSVITTQTLPVAATAYTDTLNLTAGRYQVDVAELDGVGNRSAWIAVPADATKTEFNYVVLAESSSVAAPVLNPYPAITNQSSITFTGSSVGNTEVDVLLNGVYYGTVPVVADMFSSDVMLVPNTVNTVEFVSVDSMGMVSVPAQAVVTHDAIAPLAVDVTKVPVTSNAPGTNDSLVGLAGAAEGATSLKYFSDAAGTMQIGVAVMVNADGSFPMLNLGDNMYGVVYMQLTDIAGNQSPMAMVLNPISFVPVGGITIQASQILEKQAKFTWNVVPGAVNYMVKYRAADGTYGSAMKLCATAAPTCTPELTLINLTGSTNYVVAVAAVDMYGNSSSYVEHNFKTLAPPVVTAPTPAVTVTTVAAPVSTGKTAATTKVLPSPTPSPTPTPEPTKTPEAGEVKSSTDEVGTNWTPWIILGVLAAIAALATLGYFYWFGGSAGEAALAAAAIAKEKSDKEAEGSKKNPGKDKRW
ncbi:hypothetical protein BH11PAT4_BH11PAT4_0300 [soil metagenome]